MSTSLNKFEWILDRVKSGGVQPQTAAREWEDCVKLSTPKPPETEKFPKYKKLIEYTGTPSNPLDVVRFQHELVRQQGRTTAMIDALPQSGRCVIVLLSHSMISLYMDCILRRRPTFPVNNIVWVFGKTPDEVKGSSYIRGSSWPVFVEHTVLEKWLVDTIKQLNNVS